MTDIPLVSQKAELTLNQEVKHTHMPFFQTGIKDQHLSEQYLLKHKWLPHDINPTLKVPLMILLKYYLQKYIILPFYQSEIS